MSQVTGNPREIAAGDRLAASKLLPLVYDELRKLAAARLAQEKPGQTLQATALVHEAYLRLAGPTGSVAFDNRGHFFAAAAEAMRRILVESARRKGRTAHGGNRARLPLEDVHPTLDSPAEEVLAIDDALERLATEDAAAAELVKLRYFAGLSIEEASRHLGFSTATGYRHWTYARAWIRAEVLEPPEKEGENR